MELPGYADIVLTDEGKNWSFHARPDEVVCLHVNDSQACGGDEGRATVWLTKDEVRTLSEKLKEFL